MTGVQADADFAPQLRFHRLPDCGKLLESAAYLTAFSGHGLQQNCGGLFRFQYIIQESCDQSDSGFCSLTHMTSRMKVIVIARQIFHAGQVVCHGHVSEIPGLLLFGAGIQSVWCVSHKTPEACLPGDLQEPGNILRVDGFCGASPGISRKKLKGIGPYGKGFLSHV